MSSNIVGLASCTNWSCNKRVVGSYYVVCLVNPDDIGNINGPRKKFCSAHCISEFYCEEDDNA
jgi:hypothetical protein